MTHKKMLALVLALCLVLGLCACGGQKAEETPAAPQEPVVDAPAAPPAQEPEKEEEPEAPAGTVYTVYVQDEGGNPIAGAMVQVCQGELCLMPTATDENGAAAFTVAEEAEYEAKFLMLPAGYDYTTEEQVFHFGSSFELTITLKTVA